MPMSPRFGKVRRWASPTQVSSWMSDRCALTDQYVDKCNSAIRIFIAQTASMHSGVSFFTLPTVLLTGYASISSGGNGVKRHLRVESYQHVGKFV